MRTRRQWIGAAGAALAGGLRAASPSMEVVSVRRLFHNGEHNAFTDLVKFRGTYYLTFRACPDGHMVHPSSAILVLASRDGGEWKQVHRFSVPKRDTRDPHFLIFQDRLFVYTGTWYCGDATPARYDMNQHLGYAAWSRDGASWEGPRMLEGTYGHYIWRAASHAGKAYLCGRRKRAFVETSTRAAQDEAIESALLESNDGLVFRTTALFQETFGDETAFVIDGQGALTAVARSGGNRNAQVLRSQPPFTSWRRADLGRYVGGPMLARWGGRWLVGGRKQTPGGPRCVLSWLEGDRLEDAVELPSGGDNSYPGFVALDADRGWLSYYSSHESEGGKPITAVYLAELRRR